MKRGFIAMALASTVLSGPMGGMAWAQDRPLPDAVVGIAKAPAAGRESDAAGGPRGPSSPADPTPPKTDPYLRLQGQPEDRDGGPGSPAAAPSGDVDGNAASPMDTAPELPEALAIAEAIHRLGRVAYELRLTGEVDSRDIPITLTSAEAHAASRLRITYTNAVSVMPEVSRMRVFVNNQQLVDVPIESTDPGDPRTAEVVVPSGLVEPGVNAIRIEVDARHRVDCSVNATHELWVQIDPATSGLLFDDPDAGRLVDVNDIGGLRPNMTGESPLRIVVPPGSDQAGIARILKAVEAVSMKGHFTHPDVTVGSTIQNKAGLDILVGQESQLRMKGFGDYVPDDGTHLAMRTTGTPGHAVLVVTGLDGPELDAAIQSLIPSGDPASSDGGGSEGTPSGQRALAGLLGQPMGGNSSRSFHDLGIPSQEFTGRLYRRTFDILLPPDFYAADYGRMTFWLDAGYSAGLGRGSQILVRVNDRDASSLPLGNPSGDVFKSRPVVVPLSFLRPGLNHVSIEAELYDHLGKSCDMVAEFKRKRFVLLDTSRVDIPGIARIARLPALSATAASGFPYSGGAIDVVIPHPDAEAIGAAATILSRMAVSSSVLVSPNIKAGKGATSDGSAIFVGAYSDLPSSVLNTVGFDTDVMKDLWSRPSIKSTAPPSPVRAQEVRVGATVPPAGAASASAQSDDMMLKRWNDDVTAPRWSFDPLQFAGDLINRMSGLTAGDLPRIGSAEDRVAVTRDTEIAFGQHESSVVSGATWTVAVAPSSALLRSGALHVAATRRWYLLDGRVAMFDPKLDLMNVIPTRTDYFISTEPFSFSNYRLIAAGWLSSNIFVYGGFFLVLAILLGLATSAVVKRHGEKP